MFWIAGLTGWLLAPAAFFFVRNRRAGGAAAEAAAWPASGTHAAGGAGRAVAVPTAPFPHPAPPTPNTHITSDPRPGHTSGRGSSRARAHAMQALGAMFGADGGGGGGAAAGGGAGGEASVLSAWKDYEAGGGDVEAGGISGGEAAMESEGLPFLSSSLSSAAEGVSSTLGRMGSQAKAAVSDPAGAVQAAREALPDGSNMAYATMLFGAGAFFLVIAFFIALPVLIVFPAKFALSFTTGCACIIAGITVMKVRGVSVDRGARLMWRAAPCAQVRTLTGASRALLPPSRTGMALAAQAHDIARTSQIHGRVPRQHGGHTVGGAVRAQLSTVSLVFRGTVRDHALLYGLVRARRHCRRELARIGDQAGGRRRAPDGVLRRPEMMRPRGCYRTHDDGAFS